MFALIALIATLHLTVADNHKTFTVKPRTSIVVTLPSNPSTGYRWIQEVTVHDPSGVRLVSQRYVAPRNSVPGAPGKEIWHFRAVGKGRNDLAFEYVQPWHHSRDNRMFYVTIRVS